MEEQVTACFGRTRDAEIYLSQPGLGQILAARVLGELGDDEHRYATARNRMNHAGTSPITRASGKRKTVLARFIHNDRLVDALHQQAFCALSASPGARRLLRRAPRPRHAPSRRPAAAVQPAGRHPARLPQNPHTL
jgi:Transposase IS116/IS110/IS902 family